MPPLRGMRKGQTISDTRYGGHFKSGSPPADVRVMHRSEFDRIWVPRLGPRGADEMWLLRRRAFLGPALVLIPAGAASFLFSAGTAGTIAACMLALFALGAIADIFVRRPLRIRAVACERFGVDVKGIPGLSPQAFDRWCALNGYKQPGSG